jgi:hypothetical protein
LAATYSLSFIAREASAIAILLAQSAAMPTPDPPPVTAMAAPGFFSMYTSASLWTRFTRVSEPLI